MLPPGVFACLDAVAVEVRPVVLPGPRVREKLAAGVPLLHGEDVAVDPGAVAATWACLLDALSQLAEVPHDVARIRAALDGHRLHAEHATVEALVSHPEHVHELAQAAGVSGDLVARLADLAARPILAAYARQLAHALRLGAWDAGYCPICGAWPVHSQRTPAGAEKIGDDARADARPDGESHAADVGRLLRCGRCATGWSAGAGLARGFASPTGSGFRLELAEGEGGRAGFDDD